MGTTRGRIAFTSSLLAIVAAVALVVAAFTVSMYSPEGTLAAVDPDALFAVFVPLVLAAIAFAGLSAQCTSGSVVGERAAVIALTILVLFTILTGFSIGLLVLPITALVAAAVVLTPAA